MSENKFYDGTKLMGLKDINGNTPEIFICTSNRSAGKTTYFNRYAFKKWLKKKEKFIILTRFDYELPNIGDRFFKEIRELFFPNCSMFTEKRAGGTIYELMVYQGEQTEKKSCGYAIALNKADQVKKYSHFLADATCIIFDEFQSETNKYAPDEITKFISIHTSVARGGGKQVRYVPVYMISNPVTLLNPYYLALGSGTRYSLIKRLQWNTKFLRGVGWVLEQGFNESASECQKESGFNQAFSNNAYVEYSSEGIYLRDDKSFVDKPSGKCAYVCTLKFNNVNYGIFDYMEEGYYYCSTSYDKTSPFKLAVTNYDHQINYRLLRSNTFIIQKLRTMYDCGLFRFKDLNCKECLMTALSYG